MSLPDAAAMDAATLDSIERSAARLPRFFPLDAFVASNPLHGFEALAFEHAVRQAASVFDGRGHLDLVACRARLAAGTIAPQALREVIAAQLPAQAFVLGGRQLTLHEEAWRLAVREEPAVADLAPLLAAARGLLAANTAPAPARTGWSPRHAHLLRWLDARAGTALMARHDALLCPFLQATLLPEPDGAAVHGDGSLYRRFVGLLARDPAYARVVAAGLAPAALSPDEPLAAIQVSLAALGIGPGERPAVIEQALFGLKGWAAYLQWSAGQPGRRGTLVELAAMCLVTTRVLAAELALAYGCGAGGLAHLSARLAGAPPDTAESDARRLAAIARAHGLSAIRLARSSARTARDLLAALAPCDATWLALRFLEAEEATYRAQLLARLARATPTPATAVPAAQLVFCIDVRSEPLRRALEQAGPFETYGYAGFFGAAIRLEHATGGSSDLCPALIAPAHGACERPAAGTDAAQVLATARASAARAPLGAQLKRHPLAAFGLVDGFGLLALGALAASAWRRRAAPAPPARLAPWLATDSDTVQPTLPPLSEDDQFAIARALFDSTALAAPFARLLVLCAHGSNTANNPWAAALDCGACGGHDGAANARLVAAILARPAIRSRLAAAGIELPATTVVVAALHDTTTDRVTLLDRDAIPASHAADRVRLEAALAEAGRANRVTRARQLGEAAGAGLLKRARDMAETRPEWGLARNAAFIAAPRTTTRGLDLEGRCFLHSYDWRCDADGRVLTAIMTAPLVVAQWINAHYYFASVDNRAFGSGSKVTQNIVGGRAIVQGEYGDLCLGLPLQSVQAADGSLQHDPLRLLAVVQAPQIRVDAILAAHPDVARLFDNEWLSLVVLDDEAGTQLHYRPGGAWQALGPWSGNQAALQPRKAS